MSLNIDLCITLGKGCNTFDHFLYCIDQGISKYRLNISNKSMLEQAPQIVDNFRRATSERNAEASIITDLDYPRTKIRYRTYQGGEYQIPLATKVDLVCTPCSAGTQIQIVAALFEQISVGDTLVIGDGELLLKVMEKNGTSISSEAMNDWFVSDGRGITILGQGMLSKNPERTFGATYKQQLLDSTNIHAISFVETDEDVSLWRAQYQDVKIWSKIESNRGIENITDIVHNSDAVLIARGDLVLQIPPNQLHVAEQKIIDSANDQQKRVILATEILSSLISRNFPTRAEISGLLAFISQADLPGILLTKESSFGFDILKKSIHTLGNILDIKWN